MSKQDKLGRKLGDLMKGTTRRAVGGENPSFAAPVADPALQPGERVLQAKLSDVVPSPMQPRKHFREDQLTELMESIRERGLVQPLIVRSVHGKLELIAGERRFRASEKLGLATVPVIVREATDRTVLELALIENIQRADLNPVEEAQAFFRLASEFGLTQEAIAKTVGRNRATVANTLRLLDLAADVQLMLSHGQITTGHGKALLGLKDAAYQSPLAARVIKEHLTVRQTEHLVQQENDRRTSAPTKTTSANHTALLGGDAMASITSLQKKLSSHFSARVTFQHTAKKGSIRIDYAGNDELDRILEVLGIQAD